MRFSDRIGVTKPPLPQVGKVDDALRHSLWNVLLAMLDERAGYSSYWPRAANAFAIGFFKSAADEVPGGEWDTRHWVKERFYQLQWFQVYNLFEYVAERVDYLTASRWTLKQFVDTVNMVLITENAGYRLINDRVEPITDEAEIKAVEDAMASTARAGLAPIRAHLDSALRLLAQRPAPDYRNAIKEAISAVESAAKLIGEVPGGGLDEPLKALASKTGMHPAMRDAFIKLYGYTSDSSGIRHAMLEVPNADGADARFMVIACSVFVHFLIEKAAGVGLMKPKR